MGRPAASVSYSTNRTPLAGAPERVLSTTYCAETGSYTSVRPRIACGTRGTAAGPTAAGPDPAAPGAIIGAAMAGPSARKLSQGVP